ncbi:hypothetical protein HDR60_03020 [bacterium]|nr:hypothetical protein [bacterium]
MTKEEQNQIIKDKWVENLQREKDIPDSVGEIYRNWLLGIIQQASAQLLQTQGPQDQSAEQEQEVS